VEAHENGVVSSATLMANGRAFAQAVSLAQSTPGLGVGCHVVLVDGAPLLPQTQVHSLLVGSGKSAGDARFREGISKFGALAMLGRLAADEIEAEATAQIRKLQASGIPVTHLDSHKHTHLFPRVLRPLLRAAQRCGVRAIRNPFERIQGSQLAASTQSLEKVGRGGRAARFRQTVPRSGAAGRHSYNGRYPGHRGHGHA